MRNKSFRAILSTAVLVPLAASVMSTARADYKSTILADSPTGYYRLSEKPISYAAAVNSGSGGAALNGQYQFGTWQDAGGGIAGDTSTSAQFAGVARMEVPYADALNPAGPFSIECWAMVTNAVTTNVYRSPVTSRDSVTANIRGYILYAGSNNRWQFWTGNGTAFVSLVGPNIVNDVWVHLVGTRDSLGTNRLYVNGVLTASNSAPIFAPNLSRNLRIGAGASETLLGDFYFPGRVDEVAFYGTQLSDAQVAAHFANGTNAARATPYNQLVSSDGAVGYWRMDEPAPASVLATNIGSLGSGANGAYLGSPVTLLPGQPGALAGDPDSAMGFSNMTARIDAPYNAGLNPASFTVEAWAYIPYLYRDYQCIVSTRDIQSSTTRGFILYANSNATSGLKWQFWTGRMVNSWNNCIATNSGVTNGWSHVVGTYDGTYQLLYVNGELVGALKPYLPYAPNTSAPLRIGAGATETARGDFFANGAIDDVAVYGGPLSQAAIAKHYGTAFLTPPAIVTPPTIALDPQNTTNQTGTTIKLDSIALGGVPMQYQWFKEGAPVSGQTNFVLTLVSATTADSGNYQLGITNAAGSTVSALAYLTVLPPGPPVVTGDLPTNLTVYVGGSPKLEVKVTGSSPFSYQWKSNGVAIAGATNATLILNNVQTAQSGGQYQVRVTNPYGFADSATAVLNVAVPNPAGYAAVMLAANPISYWRLGEDAAVTSTAFDYWRGNNGVYVNAIQHYMPGALGLDDDGAVQLQGTGSYMVVSNSAPYDFGGTNAFTLVAWVKPDALTAAVIQRVFSNRLLTIATAGFGFGFNGTAGLRFTSFGIVDINPAAPVVAGQWQHIAAVRSGTTVTMYHNGVSLGTSNVLTIIPSGMPLEIGGNPDPLSEYLTGEVDEAAIFGSALTSAQIKALYDSRNGAKPNIAEQPSSINVFAGGTARFSVTAAGTPPLSYQWKSNGVSITGGTNAAFVITNVQTTMSGSQFSVTVTNLSGTTNSANATLTVTVPTGYAAAVASAGPIAYWRLGETSGTTAYDSVGGYNGTSVGGVTLGVAGPSSPLYSGIEAGNTGYGLNGTDSYVQAGSFGLSGPLTISAWVKPNALSGDRAIAGENASWSFKLLNSELRFTTPGIQDHTTTGAAVTAGVWQQVAATFEPGAAGGARFYLNGQLVGSLNASAMAKGNSTFWIGNNQWTGQLFDGAIDEVVLYDKALSADAIATMYATAAYGTTTPPQITRQPASQTVVVGSNPTLSVQAVGSVPLGYQWQKGGVPIPGATAFSLTLSNVYYTDSGAYTVAVSNAVSSTTSAAATLTVMPPPTFANLTNGLVLHLKFDGGYADSSGRGNDSSPIMTPAFVGGKLGQAVELKTDTASATFNYLTVSDLYGDLSFAETNSFTVALWVKYTAAFNDLPMIGNAVNSTYQKGWVLSEDAGRLDWTAVGMDTGSIIADPVGPVINNGAWHQVSVAFDRAAAIAKTYVDGVEVDSRSIAGLGTLITGATLTLGQDPTGFYQTNGMFDLDDLGIWRRALNGYEALSIYAAAQDSTQSFDVYGPAKLVIGHAGADVVLAWQAGTLESADELKGSQTVWTPVAGAVAPTYVVTPSTAKKFYRVKL